MSLVPLPPDARWRTMVDLLTAVGDRGDRPALTATSAAGEVVGLGGAELLDAVARTSTLLARYDVGPGAVVGIHLDNTAGLEALVLHWATQWVGATAMPVGTRFVDPEVDHLLDDSGATLVCSAGAGIALAERSVARRAGATMLLDCSPGLVALTAGLPAASPAAVTEEERADLLYTSGTTGRPKGVELTHANQIATGMELVAALGLTGDDVYQSAVPYFTSTGVHTNPLPCLVAGAHLVVESAFDQHVALARAEAEGTTTYLGAPSMLALILRDVDTSQCPATLRHLVFGGSVMSAVTLGRLASGFPGRALTNLYGQTEAGPGGTVCRPEVILEKPGSIGDRGFGPWSSFAVAGDDGLPGAEPGTLGEILLRSPSVMRGYLGKPEATAEALAGGWLHTGDVGYVDDDGFLFYADRRKDLIIRGGFNISSAEVEAALVSFPGVADAAVIGVLHDVLGEDVLAVVVAPDTVAVDALLAHVRTQVADYKAPRRVTFVDELPRNAMGKVLKRELRDQLG